MEQASNMMVSPRRSAGGDLYLTSEELIFMPVLAGALQGGRPWTAALGSIGAVTAHAPDKKSIAGMRTQLRLGPSRRFDRALRDQPSGSGDPPDQPGCGLALNDPCPRTPVRSALTCDGRETQPDMTPPGSRRTHSGLSTPPTCPNGVDSDHETSRRSAPPFPQG